MGEGTQERTGYSLEMSLYEAWLDGLGPGLAAKEPGSQGITLYVDWRWGRPSELAGSASQGSLCGQILLCTVGDRPGL